MIRCVPSMGYPPTQLNSIVMVTVRGLGQGKPPSHLRQARTPQENRKKWAPLLGRWQQPAAGSAFESRERSTAFLRASPCHVYWYLLAGADHGQRFATFGLSHRQRSLSIAHQLGFWQLQL